MANLTIHEKLEYHATKREPYSFGYRHGVKLFRRFRCADRAERQRIKWEIDDCRLIVMTENSEKRSCQFAEGFLEGVHDACLEWKELKKK